MDALLANAGRGLGNAFLDQNPSAWRSVIDTNVTGTLDLIQRVARDMREINEGRILITGSIAGFIPGSYQAVYNASKAFLDSFAFALRNELKDTDVSVTCLMPGATETEFFDRAGMQDTKIGAGKKDDPADVAKAGFEAMLNGEGDVVTGWMNKLQIRDRQHHVQPTCLPSVIAARRSHAQPNRVVVMTSKGPHHADKFAARPTDTRSRARCGPAAYAVGGAAARARPRLAATRSRCGGPSGTRSDHAAAPAREFRPNVQPKGHDTSAHRDFC